MGKPTQAQINAVMRHLSERGASKGGKARAAKLSPERRREIAQAAVKARWAKEKGR